MIHAVWLAVAYLLGSIPASLLVARWGAHVDLRTHGSKNLGATNTLRVLGWRYAVPVALFDVAKGFVPVLAARQAFGDGSWMLAGVGAAAILGHVFSIFVRFAGGKGVATSSGVALALAPSPLAASAGVWLVVLFATGYVSLASMTGAVAFPLWTALFRPSDLRLLWTGVAIASFLVFTHRANIRRLIAGTESQFRRRKRTAPPQA